MTTAKTTKERFEQVTGGDEGENFTYLFSRWVDGEEESEYQELESDDTEVRLRMEDVDSDIWVSCHGWALNMENNNYYVQPDGWCELNEYNISKSHTPKLYKKVAAFIKQENNEGNG